MDLEILTLSEKSHRKINTIWYHLHVESKKNDTNEIIYKTEIDSDIENTLKAEKGERGMGKNKLRVWGLTGIYYYIQNW